jgi:ABC-type lipoprotein release transport system permease subunit
MRPVALGIVAGGAGAIWFARVLTALLYDVTPGDPLTLLLGVVALAGVTLLASLLPARRAARVDPSVVLRED